MILPSDRYRFTSHRPRRSSGLLRFIVILVGVIIVGGGVFYLVRAKSAPTGKGATEQRLSVLWKEQKYSEIATQAAQVLADRPLDENALMYAGFAYFYEGVDASSLENRIPLFDKSIVYLRRALLLKDNPQTPSVNYVLGKAYYQKGKYYLDLAIEYLNKSIEEGYIARDTYEYLGLAYSDLEDYTKAAGYFQKAIAQKPTGLLLFILAQTYYRADDTTEAEQYLLRAVNMAQSTKDTSVEEQARFLLGKIYSDRKDYFKAEDQYLRILEIDAKSADAHYYLGDLYTQLNEPVKARAEWRAALRIDPSHYGARLKLYK